MKTISLFTFATIALVSSSLFAGPPEFQPVAPAPPTCLYGTGWYAALEGGGNVWQEFDDSFSRTLRSGDVVDVKIDHNLGGYGGLKLGYVFTNGNIRPAIEEDMFYNGLSTDVHVNLNGTEVAHSSNLINSGAFMTNFILRFAFGKFQPYVGGGVGGYYAEAAGSDITINRTGRTFRTSGGTNSGSLAWDVVAGADYYWTCKFSTFLEYHFLDYVALDVGDGKHQFGQHLVGGGIRFHF